MDVVLAWGVRVQIVGWAEGSRCYGTADILGSLYGVITAPAFIVLYGFS